MDSLLCQPRISHTIILKKLTRGGQKHITVTNTFQVIVAILHSWCFWVLHLSCYIFMSCKSVKLKQQNCLYRTGVLEIFSTTTPKTFLVIMQQPLNIQILFNSKMKSKKKSCYLICLSNKSKFYIIYWANLLSQEQI